MPTTVLVVPELEPLGLADLDPVARNAALRESLELDEAGALELLEAAVVWKDELHPRWPAGTPGGLGGQFMRVGQRISWKGIEYDIDQVLPGGVYAHVATEGVASKAAYVWIPASKGTIPGAKRPPPKAIHGAKTASQMQTGQYNPTIVDPYVQADHDPDVPIPPDAPPELTPERWKKFGRADQLRYTDLMRQFGKWSPGKAQSLVDAQLAKQDSTVVSFVKQAYSSQFGSSSAFTIGFHQVFGSLLGVSSQNAQLEKARKEYEDAKAVQDAAARAIQWDLYNRVKAPDISIFHKSGDSPSWWETNILSGKAPAFSGLSQSQKYRTGFFGGTGVCTPIAIRNIVMATTSADIYKAHSFQGEQEVSVGEPMRLDGRSIVFADGAMGSSVSSWLQKITVHGADGDVIRMLQDHQKTGAALPVPPEPANIQVLGGQGVTWVAPPDAATKGAAALKYADLDPNGAPLAKPANQLDLKPGDYIEGMQGTRYIILEDKGSTFGVRYFKVTDTGTKDPNGSFSGHAEWTGQPESYEFEGEGVKPFKKLVGHFELPSQAEATHTGFVAHAWSETAADQKKSVGQLDPGAKFKVNGIPYEVVGKLAGGQTKILNLDSGQQAQINDTYQTPWLVLKAGYTEQGIPAFKPSDFFVEQPGELAGLEAGDLFYAGKTGEKVWKVESVGDAGDGLKGLHVVGISAGIEGKTNTILSNQTGRRLVPKPPGWLPPAIGDTLAVDGKKAEVTKLLKGGLVQVNKKPGVVKLKPDDPLLAGLFRPEAHHLGDKLKVKDMAVGEKFHGGTGGAVRPYLVVAHGIDRGKGKPKGTKVRNLDTGKDTVISGQKSFARLIPHGVDEPGSPDTAPVDHSEVFDPNAWKAGPVKAAHDLEVGDVFSGIGGGSYFKVVADKGAAWEVKNLLTGEQGPQVKSATQYTTMEAIVGVPVTGFDPHAYTVGKSKKLSELAKGDIFQGTKKGKHYVVTSTGAKSGLSAMDLETGKVSSPWAYDKVAPVLEPKKPVGGPSSAVGTGDPVHLEDLDPGDQFTHAGQVLEVVEKPEGKDKNFTVAPVLEGGGLGFPGKVGFYPGLLVSYHEKAPEPEPEPEPEPGPPEVEIASGPGNWPTKVVNAFSPKSKTGGGYTFSKAKNAAVGTLLQDKNGDVFKVVKDGPDPVVSTGKSLVAIDGEANLKVYDGPFVETDAPYGVPTGPEVAAPSTGGPKPWAGDLAAHVDQLGDVFADNSTTKLALGQLKPGTPFKSLPQSTPELFLGHDPSDSSMVYAQHTTTGAVYKSQADYVPSLVSVEQLDVTGWQALGKKHVSDLEPGDYYSANNESGPAVQVLEKGEDAVGGHWLVLTPLGEGQQTSGAPVKKGKPYLVTAPEMTVNTFAPSPLLAKDDPDPFTVDAGSLVKGALFDVGSTKGAPAGTYQIVGKPGGTAAELKAEHGIPKDLTMKELVWAQNIDTADTTWFHGTLAVKPLGGKAAVDAMDPDPGSYIEVGKAFLGELKYGDYFKSPVSGNVFRVGHQSESETGTPVVIVTELASGKDVKASPSMPTIQVAKKPPELQLEDNTEGWSLLQLPVGALVQSKPTSIYPEEGTAIWKLKGFAKSGKAQLEVVVPKVGEGTSQKGEVHEFDADLVFGKVKYPETTDVAPVPGVLGPDAVPLDKDGFPLELNTGFDQGEGAKNMLPLSMLKPGDQFANKGDKVYEVEKQEGGGVLAHPIDNPSAAVVWTPIWHPDYVSFGAASQHLGPGPYDESDRDLVVALAQAQQDGDEDGYFDAETAILDKLGVGVSSDDPDSLAAFDAYINGVTAQFGLPPIDAGAPDPTAGFDTPTENLAVDDEFETPDGDKWVVTDSGPDSITAEPIGNEGEGLEQVFGHGQQKVKKLSPRPVGGSFDGSLVGKPFEPLKDSELMSLKTMVTEVPVGARFKATKGDGAPTFRVVAHSDSGEIMVVAHGSPYPFAYGYPDSAVWVESPSSPNADWGGAGAELPPTKEWGEFKLGDEAWTLGGKHGVFMSPESGPAQYEKAFLIDGDPVPHQFTGPLYVSDPLAGFAGHDPGGLKVGDMEPGTVFTIPHAGYGKTYIVTEPGVAESIPGPGETGKSVLMVKNDPVMAAQTAVPLPKKAGEVVLVAQLEPGDQFSIASIPGTFTVTGKSPSGFAAYESNGTDGGSLGQGGELDPGGKVTYLGPDQFAVPLEGGEPGDEIELGGKTYTITKAEGDGYMVSDENGIPAGLIVKWNSQAVLKKKEGGPVKYLDSPLKPYSPKSQNGGGYFFADLGQLSPGDSFLDKTGTLYTVTGKTADGYYVRFTSTAGHFQAPAGDRVKLPKSEK